MRTVACTFALASMLAAPLVLGAQEVPELSPTEARTQIGEEVRVCGRVFTSEENPTGDSVLQLGGPYPYQIVTVVVPSGNLDRFTEPPHETYNEGQLCVTGTIEIRQGSPSIVAREPGVFEAREAEGG